MQTRLKLEGVRDIDFMLRDMPKNVQRGVERAFWQVGQNLKRQVDYQVLRTPKTGKYYKKPNGRRYRSSAAGESHANVTGTLRKSAGASVGGMEMEFGYGGGRIRAPKYAAAIELGRLDGTIKARPTLANSVDEEIGSAVEFLGDYTVREMD